MTEFDTVVRNAYVQERNEIVDIGISGDRIETVASEITDEGSNSINASNKLVAPSFTDCHMHNDRSFSLCGGRHPVDNEYEPDETGLRSTYTHEKFDEHFANLSTAELTENIIRDIQATIEAGTGYVRTHISLDHVPDPMLMQATLNAKEALKDAVDLQLVPYIAASVLEDEDARDLLFEAIEMGLNSIDRDNLLLGGIGTGAREGKQIDETMAEWFAIAKEYDLDLDVHIQDHGSLGGYTIEQLAKATEKYDFEGRVNASHCYSLADLPPDWTTKVIDNIAGAEMTVTTCFSSTPCSWPARELLNAGVPVGHGTDNTHDYIMPYGVSDSIQGILMESVKLTHFEDYPEDIYWYQSNEGLQALWSLITHEGATVLGVDDEYGIEEGNIADLVVLDEPSQEWAITRQATRRYVLKNGTVVVENGNLKPEYDALA
jgi:cytosine/adenosine deaminase-related metal-dependent hydrolase